MSEQQCVVFVSQAANLYGSERTMLTILEGEFPAGLRPLVVCPASGPLCDTLDAMGIERVAWEFNGATLLGGPGWNWRFFRDFCRLLKRRRPAAVVVVYEGNVPLLVLACRVCGVPVLRILQRPVTAPANRWRTRFLPDRLAFRFCDGVFCGARALGEQLERHYGLGRRPPRTLTYLPVRTTDPEVTSVPSWRARHRIPANALVVGQFSRLHPVKGLETTLRAAARVLASLPETWFVIAGGADGTPGGGEYAARLRALAGELGIAGRVVFTGVVADVFTGISACDVLVLPSLSEGLGIVALETMLLARPQVVTSVDGLGEVVSESGGGLLVSVNDDAALAARVIDLLRDAGQRSHLGENGRKWVLAHCAPQIFRARFWTGFFDFCPASRPAVSSP